MSVISSNSLFHFTSSADSLIGILKNNFFPRYSYESYSFSVSSTHAALNSGIPMICFCDLSLSQIKGHLRTYGNYGLGMNKGWGREKGLNPILYLSEDSILSNSLENILKYLVNKRLEEISYEVNISILNLLRYIKPYEGDFIYRNHKLSNFRYYNEREWRFIPNLMEGDAPPPLLNKVEFENQVIRADCNLRLESFPLTFTPNDIKYIIIKEENEISGMINSLRSIKSHFSSDIVDVLTSKILTSKQIREDF